MSYDNGAGVKLSISELGRRLFFVENAVLRQPSAEGVIIHAQHHRRFHPLTSAESQGLFK